MWHIRSFDSFSQIFSSRVVDESYYNMVINGRLEKSMSVYQTPIHLACLAGNTEEVMSMLKQDGHLVHTRDREDTPLHCATTEEVARLLIAWNADVNARGWMGQTPLHVAAAQGRLALVHLLIQHGADVNAQASHNGFTPLHEAIWQARSVERENEDIIRLLLENGANVYARDLQGRTPFHIAKGKPQLLAILSEYRGKIGPPPALTPELFVIEEIELHPHKREAVTIVKGALLARWTLDDPPHLLTDTTTTYSRFYALAVSPDGETVALAPAQEPVELRRWDDFSPLSPDGIPISNEATSLAFSPNGRWLALADREETIYVIDRTNGKVTAKTEGGEWTSALLFDPSSTLLASACSFQGGGYVRLDKLSNEGQLTTLHELGRSDYKTPKNVFVDSLIDLAFSPDGRWLALFESSSIYDNLRLPGWRGNIVLYDVATGALRWLASIDAQVTGDERSMKEAGYPMAFFTELLFVSETEIACGATQGKIVFYDVPTGKLRRSVALATNAAVHALSLDKDGRKLWIVLDDGKLVMLPL
jgi:WD40 repeat protein